MENPSLEPLRWALYGFVGVGVGILTVAATVRKAEPEVRVVKEQVTKIVRSEETLRFSKKEFVALLKKTNIRFHDIVYAQAVIETGRFSSKVFKEGNNLFGMKVARQRPTTAIGEHRGHAMYSSWQQSVLDYALFQAAYLKKCRTREEYLDYLRRNYAEDPDYVRKVEAIAATVS